VVCVLVTRVSHAKTAKLIEMAFNARNSVLDRVTCGRHLANLIEWSVLSSDVCMYILFSGLQVYIISVQAYIFVHYTCLFLCGCVYLNAVVTVHGVLDIFVCPWINVSLHACTVCIFVCIYSCLSLPSSRCITTMVIVSRLRWKIIRTVLCLVLYNSLAQWYAHTWAVITGFLCF